MLSSEDSIAFQEMDGQDRYGSKSGYLAILSVGRHSIGRDLRLKDDDAIILVDGEQLDSDPSKFEDFLKNFEDLPALLTIERNGTIFEVFANGKLGCTYKFTSSQRTESIDEQLKAYEKRDKNEPHQFEALRNIRREVILNDTTYNPFATLFPVFWLLGNRMWEPLFLVIVTLSISFLIHISLFVLTYVLFAVYFHKGQSNLFRSYCLYKEYYFWMVFTASSEIEAQKILRGFDKKCSFKHSYVGPPEK